MHYTEYTGIYIILMLRESNVTHALYYYIIINIAIYSLSYLFHNFSIYFAPLVSGMTYDNKKVDITKSITWLGKMRAQQRRLINVIHMLMMKMLSLKT